MTWIDLNPPSASDRIKYWCSKVAGYPQPRIVYNANGLGLYVVQIPGQSNLTAMGYAVAKIPGAVVQYLIAFSSLQSLKMYFPELFRIIPIAYPGPGGSVEWVHSSLNNCDNIRVALPSFVSPELLREALLQPDMVHKLKTTGSQDQPRDYTATEYEPVILPGNQLEPSQVPGQTKGSNISILFPLAVLYMFQ
jgi:hypothetical protein